MTEASLLASEIARRAHRGQVDAQGRDYFDGHLQPIADALAPLGDFAEAAGYLHDVIEDCPDYSAERLLDLGVPADVVRAVVSVTRQDGETYADLIARSCADPLGIHVKLADNAHNIACNPGLAAIDPQRAERLLMKRYLPARDRLIEARARMDPCR